MLRNSKFYKTAIMIDPAITVSINYLCGEAKLPFTHQFSACLSLILLILVRSSFHGKLSMRSFGNGLGKMWRHEENIISLGI